MFLNVQVVNFSKTTPEIEFKPTLETKRGPLFAPFNPDTPTGPSEFSIPTEAVLFGDYGSFALRVVNESQISVTHDTGLRIYAGPLPLNQQSILRAW